MNTYALIAALLCTLTALTAAGEDSIPLPQRISAFEITESAPIDSSKIITPLPDPDKKYEDNSRNWWTLLKKRQLNMKDTTVQWPKFLKFCVNVYNWGDRFFNTYDTTYVASTGKRWKVRAANDYWLDSYAMHFPKKDMDLRIMNDVSCNLGGYLHYMAVSVGYSFNLAHTLNGKPINFNRLAFNFSCSLFNIDVSYSENTGGAHLRRFGDYNDGKAIMSYFPGLQMHTLEADAYYFFNHKRFSLGAAYSFGKIQRKSAGSFLAGLSYSLQSVSMDFSTLDPELIPYYKLDSYFLKFHYNNYCVLLGYGYNWVLGRGWLFNVMVMPGIGFNSCFEDSNDGAGILFSLNAKGRMSVTYNHRNFFLGLQGRFDGHLYHSGKYTLFNSIEGVSLNTGFRF